MTSSKSVMLRGCINMADLHVLIERSNLNKPAEILGMLSSLFIWNTRVLSHLISLQHHEVILIARIYMLQGSLTAPNSFLMLQVSTQFGVVGPVVMQNLIVS